MHTIERLSPIEAKTALPALVALLEDSFVNGSSLGFSSPLILDTVATYWHETFEEVARGDRVLLVSRESDLINGSVQLAFATKQNGLHRAEIQKLVVHSTFRNRGIARALISAVEEVALERKRTLLILDTEQGSIAEVLYPKCGYTQAGIIPQYALGTDGFLHNTVVFYKLL
jgi:GNAT superfamily N-acetyltransferase